MTQTAVKTVKTILVDNGLNQLHQKRNLCITQQQVN